MCVKDTFANWGTNIALAILINEKSILCEVLATMNNI